MEGSASTSSETNIDTESLYGTLTTLEAVQSMDEDDLKRRLLGVFIEPPEATENSDEEELDEDIICSDTIRYEESEYEHLSKQHYEAYAEIVFVNHKRVITADEEEDEKPIKVPRVEENFVWEQSDFMSDIPSLFREPNYDSFKKKTPLQIFEQIFDSGMIQHIIDETSKYAEQKDHQLSTLTQNEVKIFVAILLLCGYRGTPDDLWGSEITNSKLVMKAMEKDRFEEICEFIHFADSTKINKSDKMWKLRPLMNLFQKRFLKMFKPEEHLSFGEYMADCSRRHNYFRWWNIPIGYKIWCLNTSSGYLVNFEVFQRKNSNEIKYETKFGVPGAALAQMLDDLPEKISKLQFKIYFNQFFTSMALLSHLKERGYDGTGALKDSEVPENCPLPSSKEMKTRNKGALEYFGCKDKNILIARMKKGNSVITVGSTCHGVEPVDTVVDKRQNVTEVYPSIIANYGNFKKGTTRMDESLEKNGIRNNGKKWYWPLFTWLLDVAVYNSWLVKKRSGSAISEYEFRKYIIIAFLKNADAAADE